MRLEQVTTILALAAAVGIVWVVWRANRWAEQVGRQHDTALGIAQERLDAAKEEAANLRKQCDGLIVENARLRTVVAEKTEYVEHLALDLAEAKADGICGDEAPTFGRSENVGSHCVLRHGHASQWHRGDDGSRWKHTDPDVARTYIPDGPVTPATLDIIHRATTQVLPESAPIPEYEAWKDETR